MQHAQYSLSICASSPSSYGSLVGCALYSALTLNLNSRMSVGPIPIFMLLFPGDGSFVPDVGDDLLTFYSGIFSSLLALISTSFLKNPNRPVLIFLQPGLRKRPAASNLVGQQLLKVPLTFTGSHKLRSFTCCDGCLQTTQKSFRLRSLPLQTQLSVKMAAGKTDVPRKTCTCELFCIINRKELEIFGKAVRISMFVTTIVSHHILCFSAMIKLGSPMIGFWHVWHCMQSQWQMQSSNINSSGCLPSGNSFQRMEDDENSLMKSS